MKKWKHYESFKRDRLLRKIKKELNTRDKQENKEIILLEKAKLTPPKKIIGIN